jgi:membrane-anchored protein YejM (alkaline phosphatase superfamily)
MLITKFVDRYKIASNTVDTIITSVIEQLNATSKEIKDHEVLIVADVTTEVNVSIIRHAVNLDDKTCSYMA